jgi:CubicO group peptidase (beta-lactamase class C family)
LVRYILALVWLISLDSNAYAATPAAALHRGVDQLFVSYEGTDSPGCVVGVFSNGLVEYAKGYGMEDLERNVALTPDSVFYIASTTKQFTAASVALLMLDGKLQASDEIHKYLPEFGDLGAAVTVDDLVHHESGIRDYLNLVYLPGVTSPAYLSNEWAIKLLARQRQLNFPPRTQFLYSNSNYVMLAEIVKSASGATLPTFAQERIFAPLGMTATSFGEDIGQVVRNRAESYAPRAEGGYVHFPKVIAAYGDGNLLTTVRDLARWDENFYSGKVGGAAFLTKMRERGTLSNGAATDYGYGLFYQGYRGQPTVSHDGGFDGFRTELLRFPRQHFR